MEALESEISIYEQQLCQVQASIAATKGPDGQASNDELVTLESELSQLIQLSKQTLLEMKREELLNKLKEVEDEQQKSDEPKNDEVKNQDVQVSESQEPSNDTIEDDDNGDNGNDDEALMSSLEGSKCRAPHHSSSNGSLSYHNAIIFSVEGSSGSYDDSCDRVMVRVVFSHPTETSMVPCKFYMSGSCKFDEEKCKFSHGEVVDFAALKDFEDPDYTKVKASLEGTRLLALDANRGLESSGLWKHATLVQFESEEKVHIRYEQGSSKANNMDTVTLESILPLRDHDEESEDALSDEEFQLEESNFTPVDLALSRNLSTALSSWESFTNGIGSKLMASMGYVHGAGLGKAGQGRVEPVPVMVYPSGKSLDWCMDAKANTADLTAPKGVVYLDQKRRMQEMRKQHKMQEKERWKKKRENAADKPDLFEIINSRIHGKGGSIGGTAAVAKTDDISQHGGGLKLSKDLSGIPSTSSSSSHHEDNKRKLNVENFKTMEKLQKNQREIDKVQASLKRSKSKGDKAILDQKLQRLKGYRDQLKSHERNVESSLSKRSKRKLEIF